MLRHRQASARDHKRRGGRNVEGLSPTRSGSCRVDETTVTAVNPNRALSHALSQSGEFFNRLAFELQSDQCRRDLRISSFTVKQGIEKMSSLIAGKILAACQACKKVLESENLRFCSRGFIEPLGHRHNLLCNSLSGDLFSDP